MNEGGLWSHILHFFYYICYSPWQLPEASLTSSYVCGNIFYESNCKILWYRTCYNEQCSRDA